MTLVKITDWSYQKYYWHCPNCKHENNICSPPNKNKKLWCMQCGAKYVNQGKEVWYMEEKYHEKNYWN